MSAISWIDTNLSATSFDQKSELLFELNKSSSFWIVKSEEGVKCFANKCGHMGAKLGCSNGAFVCPVHNWKYDLHGRNFIEGSPGLAEVPIRINDFGGIEIGIKNYRKASESKPRELIGNSPQLYVHSHACIELKYEGKSLLTDPWLVSPAYFGSWHLFPRPSVTPETLHPDAIIITHPHPDHFHPETMARFNRELPIFFPKFHSRFIDRTLDRLGFLNLKPTLFGEDVEISDNFKFKFLQPQSFWEDSSVLVTAGDWTWLNQNDAGSILDDSQVPLEIDLLSTSFDQGASGYPLTWENINTELKPKLMELSKTRMLRLLPARADQVSARYFLPFAGHWRLGLSEHKHYSEMIPHTKLAEVTQAFSNFGTTCEVLELLPGDNYDFRSNRLEVNPESHREYLDGFSNTVERVTASELEFDFEKFRASVEDLASNSEALRCESVLFQVLIDDYPNNFEVQFGSQTPNPISIKVSIPKFIACLLAEGLTNWDHVAIGYWGKWGRDPDIYPPNFMRLMQIGYQSEFRALRSTFDDQEILRISIADLIEHDPNLVSAVLSRAGMPCDACSRVNSESLEDAFNLHSINLDWQKRVLAELKPLTSHH